MAKSTILESMPAKLGAAHAAPASPYHPDVAETNARDSGRRPRLGVRRFSPEIREV